MTVEAGAILSIGSNRLELTGDFENNGTVIANNGTVRFSGSESQEFSGSSLIVKDVVVDKSGGELSLLQDVNVDGTLTLTNGLMALDGGNLNIRGAAITGAGPSSYVVTRSSSCMRIPVAGSNVIFPVGASIEGYSPAILNNVGTADTFCIRVIDRVFVGGGESGTEFSEGVVGKTWFIDEDVAGGSDVTLTLQWRNADEKNGFNMADARITHYNSGLTSWEPKTSNPVADLGSGRFEVTALNITDFSPFGVGSSDAALPIELLFFKGQRQGRQVVLTWATASEQDNDFFTIERGAGDQTFELLAVTPGQGTTDQRTDYQHVDDRPLPGNNHYRLKQTDFDGGYSYSQVILVTDGIARTPELSIYPNANNGVDFTWSLDDLVPNSQAVFTLTDLQGQVLRQQVIDLGTNGAYSGSGFQNLLLEPGVYILRVVNEDQEMVSRLIVR